ncbi:subclass B3 metallo-beta-lactamase [Phenylobacterium sp. LjRoot225]|uniref:subclass B3 metallo-beta-lactamase n=1 Tax=Phenylobacterium sp. LjRoot225 TaxID=3342285 RepID=UPI003ECC481B
MKRWISAATIALAAPQAVAAQPAPDPLTAPIPSSRAADWMKPQTPLRIWGDTYYVGLGGLSVVLIKSDAGLILIDGSMPQSAAMVEAHIRQLGFRVEDIKYILVTEPHFDHAGGVAAIARDSGATAVASPATAKALRAGAANPDDPQYGSLPAFPAVTRVREIGDGQSVRLGRVTVTARFTPGHTAGSTSWTWTSCETGRCLNMVFAASLNPVSATGFRFSDIAAHGDLPAVFRRSRARLAALPCDVLVSAHPDNSGADLKLKALQAGRTPNPFIDPGACRAYAAKAQALFAARMAKEKAERPG